MALPTGFSHWFDTAVLPVIVEGVGKKRKQPPPMPNVVLVSRTTPDGDARLKKAFDLILKAVLPFNQPSIPTESQDRGKGDGSNRMANETEDEPMTESGVVRQIDETDPNGLE